MKQHHNSTSWTWNPAPVTVTSSLWHLATAPSTATTLEMPHVPGPWVRDNIPCIHPALCGFDRCFKHGSPSSVFLATDDFKNTKNLDGHVCHQSSWNIQHSINQTNNTVLPNNSTFCIKYDSNDTCKVLTTNVSTKCGFSILISNFIDLGMYNTILQEWTDKYNHNNKSLIFCLFLRSKWHNYKRCS